MFDRRKKHTTGRYKGKLQTQIAALLLGMFLLYTLVYLPESLFSELRTAVGKWGEYCARLGMAISGVVLARWIVFAQDTLANGTNRWSQFFRSQFPDQMIMDKYSCSKAEATSLWFKYFNSWENGPPAYRAHHSRTFYRSYGCRLIYYLKQWLMFFAAGGATTMGILWVAGTQFTRWTPCFLLIAVSVAVFFILWRANRIPGGEWHLKLAKNWRRREKPREASGCWRKFQEISEMQKVLLEKDILSCAQTFEEAWSLASEWERRAADACVDSDREQPAEDVGIAP